ncbi:arylesterase [Chytriomyces confervae]|uniref:Arylesterase n=1 Tax=Chytriomyces confervae TaxID=246404 RepID=A0A507FH64_9FUNG|nr:arylesterase [Chytriomyces confervae]
MLSQIASVLGVILLAVLAIPLSTHLRLSGVYPPRNATKPVSPKLSTTRCATVADNLNIACETLATNPQFGVAYLACENPLSRSRYNPGFHAVDPAFSGHGAVYSMNLKNNKVSKLDIPNLPVNLSILGLDFYVKDATTAIINVINHHPTGARIETLSHKKGSTTLDFVDSVESKSLFNWPNSIATMPDGSFYVTSGLVGKTLAAKIAETMLPLPWGSILYYNAATQKTRVVAKDIQFSNGIAKSPNNEFIYAAGSTSGALHVYKVIDPETGALKLVEKVALDFYLDNVSVHPRTGAVYVTGHSNGPRFLMAMANPTVYARSSGSLVAKVVNNTGEDVFYGHKYKSSLVFVGDDPLFATASHVVVAPDFKKTIFGSLFSKGVVVCDWEL